MNSFLSIKYLLYNISNNKNLTKIANTIPSNLKRKSGKILKPSPDNNPSLYSIVKAIANETSHLYIAIKK